MTSAVTLSVMTAFFIKRIAGPLAANFTSSTIGEGMLPSCATVTVVRIPCVFTLAKRPSTLSVVKSQLFQNQLRSRRNALFMKNM